MKKTLLLLTMILISVNSFALDNIFGLSAGYNGAWFSGGDWDKHVDNYYDQNEMKSGMSFGLFYDIGINKYFSIQPEMNFVKSGGKTSSDNNYDSGEDVYYDDILTEKITLLTFPVYAKLKLKTGKGRITLFAGPMLTLLIGAKEEYYIDIDGYGSGTATGNVDADNNWLFGYSAGTGYETPMGVGYLITNVRYSQILNSYLDELEIKINNFGVNVGYGFRRR